MENPKFSVMPVYYTAKRAKEEYDIICYPHGAIAKVVRYSDGKLMIIKTNALNNTDITDQEIVDGVEDMRSFRKSRIG